MTGDNTEITQDADASAAAAVDADDDDELVDAKEACAILGGRAKPIHVSTLNRGVRTGKYSPPVEIGEQLRRWIKGELRRDVRRLADQRRRRT